MSFGKILLKNVAMFAWLMWWLKTEPEPEPEPEPIIIIINLI